MIGPLQQRLLQMMETCVGTTAASLHKALIRDFGDKGPSYSTVLSVLRNLARRRPDLLVSTKVKQQLRFTLQMPIQRVHNLEYMSYVRGVGWEGNSPGYLEAISCTPKLPTAIHKAIQAELTRLKDQA